MCDFQKLINHYTQSSRSSLAKEYLFALEFLASFFASSIASSVRLEKNSISALVALSIFVCKTSFAIGFVSFSVNLILCQCKSNTLNRFFTDENYFSSDIKHLLGPNSLSRLLIPVAISSVFQVPLRSNPMTLRYSGLFGL